MKNSKAQCRYGQTLFHLGLLFLLAATTESWIPLPCTNSHARPRRRVSTRTSSLASSSDDDSLCRISVSGVSVSSDGFWMLLKVPSDGSFTTLPIQVTTDTQDAVAATSAESLTLLQLISGVDMAGPILPPEFLGQATVLHCEYTSDNNKTLAEQAILDLIQDTLPSPSMKYSECNVWQRSRVRLPKVTLNQVRFVNNNEWLLECSVPQFPQMKTILVRPTRQILQETCYQYDETTSAAFSSLALALRYKAPIVVMMQQKALLLLNQEELKKRFPMLKTVASLHSQSERVHENIERGFEIHKLTGALRIAMEKGDEMAAKSIREKLDQYDSMDDLPTLGDEDNGGVDQMQ